MRETAVSVDNCSYPLRQARISADNDAWAAVRPGPELSG
jgi:hypothetical protein